MNKTVLVLNAGSSSVKFTVYTSDGAQLTMRYNGQIEGLGSQPHSLAKDAQGQVVEEHRWKSRGDDDRSAYTCDAPVTPSIARREARNVCV
jgi:acetate kinase